MAKRRTYILLAAVLAALLLASCDTMSAEDFYALPQLSDTYLQLQQQIDGMLDSGAEYSAPASGSNRQAVQLHAIQTAAFHAFRQKSEEISDTAGRLQDIAGMKTHLLHGGINRPDHGG